MAVKRLTFDLTLAAVRPIVAGLDPRLKPTGIERLHGGSTEVFLVKLMGSAPLIVKLYGDTPEWLPAKEALVAGWVSRHIDVPVPRWLIRDESRIHLPLRYALTSWLPGVTVDTLKGDVRITDLYRQAGQLLRCVHRISMPAYGYVQHEGIARPYTSNTALMDAAFNDVFRRFRATGGDESLAQRLETLAADRTVLAASTGPVLCHDDFHQNNLLAAEHGDGLQLSGLLDFGNARAADPLFDLAKTLFIMAHQDPASREPLLAGYGRLDQPCATEALRLYLLYHRLNMWAFLSQLGDKPDALLADITSMVG